MVLVVGAHRGAEGSTVSQYLAQYASILATQGALTTALYFLSSNSAADTQVDSFIFILSTVYNTLKFFISK